MNWRKSSYSGGNGGSCVEVANLPDGGYAVRDSKRPGGPVLRFAAAEWTLFVQDLKTGP
ncbi:DUF397 domain-containing protein [Sphaerisporangium rubeum]|uniref:DUF397 domain-containing protein n=1 Tax=Sphaerisporangium rubeum TaxID=321317 RepID=A0A7X0IFH8_9ACTN|nr:DUF397 domain-containing protein [Sphaerisporangium rubeum]MBB6472737.1 hypothetical protein [Sphaerisporangium rubeum]